MNILFIVPPPYFPNKLHRVRSYNLLKILSQEHSVHLLSVTTNSPNPNELTAIKKWCTSLTIVHTSHYKGLQNILLHPHLPYEVAYCQNTFVKHLVSRIVKEKKIDLIYLKRLRTSIYLDKQLSEIPTVLDTTDAMSLFYKRMYNKSSLIKRPFYFFEFKKYQYFEKQISKRIPTWVVCSEMDKLYLSKQIPNTIITIPNITDVSKTIPKQNKQLQHPVILFQGLMDKPVNVDAALFFTREIFPLIQKNHPKSKLIILGPNPTKKIRDLADRNTIVTGYVKNSKAIYNNATVVVCPLLYGTGTKNKILSAWAYGIPVVSTTIGAEGLYARHKTNILIADDPSKFAEYVNLLLSQNKERLHLAKYGLETVKKYYTEKSITKPLIDILHYVKSNKTK